MIGAAAGLVPPALAVALWLRRIDRGVDWLTALLWSVPLAVGASSLVWWAFLLLGLPSRAGLVTADAAIWIAVGVLLLPRSTATSAPQASQAARGGPGWIPLALLIVTGGLASTSFVAASLVVPHGEWDAWAIWNLRARFLYLGYPSHWRDAFSPFLDWSHVEYPLLLPLAVSREWMYAGRDSAAVPVAVAAIFSVGIVAVACRSVWRARSTSRAAVTAAAILASPAFVRHSSSQCADIPLAFYVLGTFLWISRAVESPSNSRSWYVAGASAGLAAWTKNEGILFLGLCLFLVAVMSSWLDGRAGWRSVFRFFAGAAPMIAALVSFKALAPENEIAASLSMQSVVTAFGDAERVKTVGVAVARELWLGGAASVGVLPILATFVLIAGLRRPWEPGPLIGLSAAVVLIGCYAAVYVVTPYDLAWHMRTSIDRVMLHAFPTLVWGGMMITRE